MNSNALKKWILKTYSIIIQQIAPRINEHRCLITSLSHLVTLDSLAPVSEIKRQRVLLLHAILNTITDAAYPSLFSLSHGGERDVCNVLLGRPQRSRYLPCFLRSLSYLPSCQSHFHNGIQSALCSFLHNYKPLSLLLNLDKCRERHLILSNEGCHWKCFPQDKEIVCALLQQNCTV